MQKNRSVPDVQRKRSQWIETISGANAEHQIYLDESGINTNLIRHYAHAVHGKRAMDTTLINTPAGTTVLSSIRINGSLVMLRTKVEQLHSDFVNIWENN